jgi:hypothetical protein
MLNSRDLQKSFLSGWSRHFVSETLSLSDIGSFDRLDAYQKDESICNVHAFDSTSQFWCPVQFAIRESRSLLGY